jgi:hypothetical protein
MAVSAISVTIKLAPKAHQRLFEMGKARGYAPSAFAQLLFDAAFAARIGMERGESTGDSELDEQVKLVFRLAGDVEPAAIAKATGLPEERVTRILEGWRIAAREEGGARPRRKGAAA